MRKYGRIRIAILRIHSHDGKSKLLIFYQQHPDTIRKNILVTTNGKSWNDNHNNEMESNIFKQIPKGMD